MTIHENKDIARRFYDVVWIERDMTAAQDLIAPTCVRHDPSGPVPAGPAGFAAMVDRWRAAFSDFSLVVDFALGEGDLVAVRWTINATHTGAFAGVSGSGKAVTFSGVNIFRIEHGRIAEIWNHRDDLAVYQQIGAFTLPAST